MPVKIAIVVALILRVLNSYIPILESNPYFDFDNLGCHKIGLTQWLLIKKVKVLGWINN